MERFAEANRVAGGNEGSDGNRFFSDAASKWYSHTFPLLQLVVGKINLNDVYEMIVSAPKSAEQAKSEEWQKNSFCSKIFLTAADMAETGDAKAQRIIDEHGAFWVAEIPHLGDKTRSSIEATLTNSLYYFLSGKMSELFTSDTTFVPEMVRQGKVIILDLPVLKHGPVGAIAQSIFKYLFGLALQREAVTKHTRPAFLWADECQFFLSETDAELLSTARSSRLCNVFITQDLPTFYAQLGSGQKDLADSIVSKFGTRVFHASTSRETNEAASEIIGKVTKYNISKSHGTGRNSGGGLNQGEETGGTSGGDGRNLSVSRSYSSYQDYAVPPDYFANSLRTGGPKNRKKVDAILIRNGANFRQTKRHWMKVEFSQ